MQIILNTTFFNFEAKLSSTVNSLASAIKLSLMSTTSILHLEDTTLEQNDFDDTPRKVGISFVNRTIVSDDEDNENNVIKQTIKNDNLIPIANIATTSRNTSELIVRKKIAVKHCI